MDPVPFLLSSLRMLEMGEEGLFGRRERLFRRTSCCQFFLTRRFTPFSKVRDDTNNTNNSMILRNLFSSFSLSYHHHHHPRRWEDLEKSWTRSRVYNSSTKEDDWKDGRKDMCVCTNLDNSTAPRCTFRFRDTDLPRKCRCARPPNRNYDNCTCNRHEWAKECHPRGE